ncbi:hypothetical protein SAMN04487914_1791 [Arthrobacter sp. ok909]|uniref:hypothetical protein n=1 Tax=Arthrobacter sp. ok909 TaxID=1761746 RepID=UPI00087F29CB|nr:hypothetical protein [Arthrobacter sp. ok909]SDP86045.1 hypothetical protein SAMN04487914_1791 [Arthrobacter sp. ok909]
MNLIACDRSPGAKAMPVSTAGAIIAASGPTYHVTADAPRLIGERLDAAEHLARQQALKEGAHGILVTRHGPTTFTVALSADVPYGVTMERELA